MKTKITALALSAVTALSFTPKPAQADDKGLALLGGFIGGMIIASAINDSNHGGYHEVYSTDCAIPVAVNDRCDDRGASGYWNVVAVQVWVPGCWVETRDYYGCHSRRYVSGHYECRRDRVWVSRDRHGSYDRRDDRRDRDHDRDDRGYRYEGRR